MAFTPKHLPWSVHDGMRVGAALLCASLVFGLGLNHSSRASASETNPELNLRRSVGALAAPGLHNLFALGTNIYSGSAPEGEAGFASLAKIGIKTVISVDGSLPDVATAHKFGLRYVHLPHGYDGIAVATQRQMIKATRVLPGPIYVHCHHGKHRGPTAAAVICMANFGWTPVQARSWLSAAGTATNYTGLLQTVRDFQKPTPAQLEAIPANFPETAKVSRLVDAMVAIDNQWEQLKAIRQAGYEAPPTHPDLSPSSEAEILREHFREAQRLPEVVRRDADFVRRLKIAESGARETERLLNLFAAERKPAIRDDLDKAFDAIDSACVSCHRAFRDSSGIQAIR